MPEDQLLDALQDSSPADDIVDPSSTVEPDEPSQEGTAPTTQDQADSTSDSPDNTPFHQHPRWQEVQAERERLRAQNELYQQQLQQYQSLLSRGQQPATPPPKNPWDELTQSADPATAQFYQQMRQAVAYEAEQIAAARTRDLEASVNAGRAELAQVTLAQFRKDNPEITPGSPEELQIAQMVQQGYPLEHARRIVLWDKVNSTASAASKKAQRTAQATVQKRAANMESSAGLAPNNALPKPKKSFRDELAEGLTSLSF